MSKRNIDVATGRDNLKKGRTEFFFDYKKLLLIGILLLLFFSLFNFWPEKKTTNSYGGTYKNLLEQEKYNEALEIILKARKEGADTSFLKYGEASRLKEVIDMIDKN